MTMTLHRTARTALRAIPACCILAATLMTGLTAGASAAESGDMFPAPVFVTLQKNGSVEALPSGMTWNGLTGAHYDAVSPDGRYLLVSSVNLPEAYLLDTSTGKKVGTFHVGPVPQGVAISPDGRWGLAVGATDGTVTVIDIRKHKKLKTVAVGKGPHNAVFTADGRKAYVTLQGGGAVVVLDTPSFNKVDEFPVPGLKGPHNLDLSADGKTLWIRGFVGQVAAVDLSTHKVLAVIPVGLGHAGITVAPDGYVFTGAIADHVVDVIDPSTYKVIKRIDVGQGPHGVRASADGRWIYASVTGTNKVAVIDAHSLEVAKQIPLKGQLPFFVAIPASQKK